MRVAFLVTHLSGSGHLARTLALARGVAARGAEAVVVSGGRPLPHLDAAGVRLVQLPPLAVADHDYARLLTPEGAEASPGYLAARASAAAAAVAGADRLVVEHYPFGRRSLADEFEAAIAAAGGRALVSVRDFPEPPRKARRVPEVHDALRRWCAGVLVHGDAALVPFSLGWPGAAEIADLLRPTGYIAEALPPPEGDPDEVLVAEGGGDLGRPLLAAAVAAARLGTRRWRLRVGGADAAAEAARLNALAAGAPVIAEPAAPDYRARLRTCAASVSLAGYNTAVALLQTGAPAVLVPISAPTQQEQRLRAGALARLPQFERLDATDPAALAAAVTRAMARGRGAPPTVALDGVARAAAAILG
jgi:predicted glycosyltransferase